LDEDEKVVGKVDGLGGTQKTTLINESGLYSVISRTNKPEGARFRRWVTRELIPSFRK
jgi:prophage antirepressor-like protein